MSSGLITSTDNPKVKRLRRLRGRRYRDQEQVFLVEGIAHVRQALDRGAPVESVVVAPELLTSAGALRAVERAEAAGTSVLRLSRAAFESVTERDHPSGLAATVRYEDAALTSWVAEEDSVFVALHDVGNPGNLGSIIRTADAVAARGVILVGESTDHRHPAAVKASMGTLFTTPVCRAGDMNELLAWCAMEDVSLVTTSAKTGAPLWQTRFPRPMVVLFGSEAEGLAAEIIAEGTAVRIPMQGAASSLNLAVAAGIFLFEAQRQLTGS